MMSPHREHIAAGRRLTRLIDEAIKAMEVGEKVDLERLNLALAELEAASAACK